MKWKLVTGKLPAEGQAFAKEHEVTKYMCQVIAAYQNTEDPTQWVMVTDGASAYKVGAEYMIWTPTIVRAAWSYRMMIIIREAYLNGREVPQDPEYQT